MIAHALLPWLVLLLLQIEKIEPVEPDIPLPPVEEGRLRWIGSLGKALAEARLRAVPVVVVLGPDTSPAVDAMLGSVFLAPGFAKEKEAATIVPLIALEGQNHVATDVETDQGKTRLCSIFQVPCSEHEETYKTLQKLMIHRSYWFPLILMLDPAGKEVLRLEGKEHTRERVVREIRYGSELVAKEFGAGIDEKTYRKLIAVLARSRKALEDGNVRQAIQDCRSLEKASGLTEAFRELVAADLRSIEARGDSEIRAALELASSNRTEAIARLRRIAREYAGLEVGTRAKEELGRVAE